MPELFRTTRRVEFCETDAAGIAHFSAFMCYMEQAEHAFLRSLGFTVVQPLEGGVHLSWPRVHVECDYKSSARFEDELEVTLRVLRLGNKSVTYGLEFSKDGQVVAKGKVIAVCCHVHPQRPLAAAEIPKPLADALRRYLHTEGQS